MLLLLFMLKGITQTIKYFSYICDNLDAGKRENASLPKCIQVLQIYAASVRLLVAAC